MLWTNSSSSGLRKAAIFGGWGLIFWGICCIVLIMGIVNFIEKLRLFPLFKSVYEENIIFGEMANK
jgi:hypothetical protein